jgi:cytoskeletal protein RodZ
LIGEKLKKRREELGIDLKQVANTLRIHYEYLKCIENNALDKLPAQVYTRGYIKEYARFLNVDPDPLLDEHAKSQSESEGESEPVPQAPLKTKFVLPRSVIFIAIAVIAIVLVAVGFFLRGSLAPPESTGEADHAADVKASPLPAAPAGSVKENTQAPYVLKVIAEETSWLRVESGEGRSEEVLMQPGETKEWTSQNGFDIKLGNAGGVKLIFNGKDLGTLGEKGRVVRLRLARGETSDKAPSTTNDPDFKRRP